MNLVVVHAGQAAALASVHAQAFERPWEAAVFETLLSGPGAFALLAATDDPAGIAVCRVAGDEAEVLTLGVAPWARRSGVARTLMAHAISLAREAGARTFLLEVDAENAAAIGLYGGLGFAQAGRRKGYYDRGGAGRTDALVMRLDLGEGSD